MSGVFVSVDTQAQACPAQGAMDQFLANLDASQKNHQFESDGSGSSLYWLYLNYPIEEFADDPSKQPCDAGNGNPGYWDATTSLQSNGELFINGIIKLMKRYN